MNEKPILFSAPMVRAILAGQKTQTRRIVNPDRVRVFLKVGRGSFEPGVHRAAVDSLGVCVRRDAHQVRVMSAEFDWLSPYGRVGDCAWVRETWAAARNLDGVKPSDPEMRDHAEINGLWFAADDSAPRPLNIRGGWRPSIFLPRWGSRISLRIESVRVEHLADITEADAIAEGLPPNEVGTFSVDSEHGREEFPSARAAYFFLWDSINPKAPHTGNPLVYRIEFSRINEGGPS